MFARVTSFEGSPEGIEEGIRIFRTELIPWFREATGFRGFVVLVDRKRGRALGISFWTSEETMRDPAAGGGHLRDDLAATVGTLMRGLDYYEVAYGDSIDLREAD
ncbi:MAG TPA: hypothetical protein VK915_13540 [Gaiellaceae bacterium]|nr:hypothetical protein [Gaiellaceae bacterium]